MEIYLTKEEKKALLHMLHLLECYHRTPMGSNLTATEQRVLEYLRAKLRDDPQ